MCHAGSRVDTTLNDWKSNDTESVNGTQSVLTLPWPGHQLSHFEKSSPQPEIKVHLNRFNFQSVLRDFRSFIEKPVFECSFAHPMILFLLYRVSVLCKLAIK